MKSGRAVMAELWQGPGLWGFDRQKTAGQH